MKENEMIATVFSHLPTQQFMAFCCTVFADSETILPNMHDVRILSDAELIDMLSEQTRKLTQLLQKQLSKGEYQKCKLLIQALTLEIEERKRNKTSSATADLDNYLAPEV